MSFSSRLEDSSEQVKRELAGVVGQLSCLQSDTSHLSGVQSCSELFCQTLGLASEHAGTSIPCLGASFVKPFLPLLAQQSPSSVKQGISYSASPFGAASVNDTLPFCSTCILFFSFPRCFASSLPARQSCQWRQRLPQSPQCSDWSNEGL